MVVRFYFILIVVIIGINKLLDINIVIGLVVLDEIYLGVWSLLIL